MPGSTTATIFVPINSDGEVEGEEVFGLEITRIAPVDCPINITDPYKVNITIREPQGIGLHF